MESPFIKIRSSFWQRWLQQLFSFVIRSVLIVNGRSMIFGLLLYYHQCISFLCRYWVPTPSATSPFHVGTESPAPSATSPFYVGTELPSPQPQSSNFEIYTQLQTLKMFFILIVIHPMLFPIDLSFQIDWIKKNKTGEQHRLSSLSL